MSTLTIEGKKAQLKQALSGFKQGQASVGYGFFTNNIQDLHIYVPIGVIAGAYYDSGNYKDNNNNIIPINNYCSYLRLDLTIAGSVIRLETDNDGVVNPITIIEGKTSPSDNVKVELSTIAIYSAGQLHLILNMSDNSSWHDHVSTAVGNTPFIGYLRLKANFDDYIEKLGAVDVSPFEQET